MVALSKRGVMAQGSPCIQKVNGDESSLNIRFHGYVNNVSEPYLLHAARHVLDLHLSIPYVCEKFCYITVEHLDRIRRC